MSGGTAMRRMKRGLIGAVVLSAVCAATALAAGNSVTAHAPTGVRVGSKFSIKLTGHAKKPSTLYMFLDTKACGATPAVEHTTHGANGDYWLNVDGTFSKTSKGWVSHLAAKIHICSYLVKGSAPINPNGAVLAHDFVAFRVSP